MSAPIARKVVQSFRKPASKKLTEEPLTERENEILVLLAQGFTYQEIGQQLFISRDTVHSHIRSIYRKMQVRSRTEAVVKFLDHK
jgi:DNA-binding NarL/FixJ family response regulator